MGVEATAEEFQAGPLLRGGDALFGGSSDQPLKKDAEHRCTSAASPKL
jgi:hypothetical protein